MCFSATADFVAAGVVGGIGVGALTQVRTVRDVPFAALPLLFALHQFTEGFVWLSLEGHVSTGVGDVAAFLYVLYAYGLLPILVPLSLLLIEPPGRRRVHMVPFVVIGAITSIYLFWASAAGPIDYGIAEHSLSYDTHAPPLGVAAVGYVLATVGAALLAGYPAIVAFGIANAVGLTATLIVLQVSFASIWCVYAAVTSTPVLVFFLRRNRAQGEQVRRHQQEAPAPMG
ncbi:hypothetical protein SAMN05661080_00505 [Modestobacter sp. DSM 44400]|uniref:DUF6629 family protein n=1 Tax=Modestobacter sp. DSM 44400 TaxID=1550230 RepID=UPI00089DA0C1|nr:DUF6629 family protein [Modestobacter sp. DSM 44400]SDX59582.1 hypothetical protein SAMN05661080_00505 [Modestobacter sp. DSM 44400]